MVFVKANEHAHNTKHARHGIQLADSCIDTSWVVWRTSVFYVGGPSWLTDMHICTDFLSGIYTECQVGWLIDSLLKPNFVPHWSTRITGASTLG